MPIIGKTDAHDRIFAKKFGEEVFEHYKRSNFDIKCKACNQRFGSHGFDGGCPKEYVKIGGEYIKNWKRTDTAALERGIKEMRSMISKLEAT